MITKHIGKYILVMVVLAHLNRINGMYNIKSFFLDCFGRRQQLQANIVGFNNSPNVNTSPKITEPNFQGIEPECVICLEQFQTDEVITKCPCACKAAYHSHCLTQALEEVTHRECPLCRTRVDQIPNGVCFKLSLFQLDLLNEVRAGPTQETLKKAIERGSYAIVKLVIQAGVTPRVEHLTLAKEKYEKTGDALFKKIGKMLIECLRLTQSVGCESVGPISKKGIVAETNSLPAELADYIATFMLE